MASHRLRHAFTLALFSVLLMIWPGALASGLLVGYDPLSGNPALEATLLLHTNSSRAAQGLPPLVQDESLALAARHHAAEMARFNYLDHESPVAENRTLAQRLNRAGALLQATGENLALLAHVPDVARAAVDGWMESPGHRASMLGDFTHVGFGVAQNARGETYVVQVLGKVALVLEAVSIRSETREMIDLEVGFTLAAEREVAFWFGEVVTEPRVFGAGSHTVRERLPSASMLHVNTGLRSVGAGPTQPFIAADAAWFEPAADEWRRSGGADAGVLRIEGVSGTVMSQDYLDIGLLLSALPDGAVGVWLDGQWLVEHYWSGSELRLVVPAAAAGGILAVGTESPQGSGQYQVAARFRLVVDAAGRPALEAVNPGSG